MQAVEPDRQLLMQLHGCGPRDPVELPAPSLATVAVAVARRRPQRRLPRCPLPRPLPRAPVELLARARIFQNLIQNLSGPRSGENFSKSE